MSYLFGRIYFNKVPVFNTEVELFPLKGSMNLNKEDDNSVNQ